MVQKDDQVTKPIIVVKCHVSYCMYIIKVKGYLISKIITIQLMLLLLASQIFLSQAVAFCISMAKNFSYSSVATVYTRVAAIQ